MWTFGPLGIATPLALLGLLALPVIWLIIRALPPTPSTQMFPPAALLARVAQTEETPAKAPIWLVWFRMILLALLVTGFSGPVLNPVTQPDPRPLLIVLDDGWTSAPAWAEISKEAARSAEAARGPVRIVMTASTQGKETTLEALSPKAAAARILAAQPQPLLPDPNKARDQINAAVRTAPNTPDRGLTSGQRIVWFSDGISHAGSQELAKALSTLGPVKLRTPSVGAVAISRVMTMADGYRLTLVAAPAAAASSRLEAINSKGQVLRQSSQARSPVGADFALESVVMGDVAALRVGDVRAAGGVFLLDAFDRRVRAGLITERRDDQPLLSDAHYLESALKPYADLTRSSLDRLVDSRLDVLILPDAGDLSPPDQARLTSFVEDGGLLIRTAGPKILASPDNPLLPSPLLGEARTVRGAMSWDDGGKIAAFEPNSPFAGLIVANDARVNQVVVAAPTNRGDTGAQASKADIGLEIWARLVDGTPLVSARRFGKGMIVLFHTTAGPAWSDVAFSGLQVEMFRRVLARAASSAIPANIVTGTSPLKPVLVLDGYGNFRTPEPGMRAIRPENVAGLRPSLTQPPGIYEGGGARWILQAAAPDVRLPPLANLPGVTRADRADPQPRELAPIFFGIGMILVLIDLVLSLLLAGKLNLYLRDMFRRLSGLVPKPPPVTPLILIATLVMFTSLPQSGWAQTSQSNPATGPGDVSLAYVKTGDAALDGRTQRGLEGLSRALRERTSVATGPVIGLDPARDDLALYPIVFWTLGETVSDTRPEVAQALDRYMKTGGVLFVDTRGAGRTPAAARQVTRAALRGIEAPPLAQVPEGHVLTKAFYILQRFPGRYPDAKLWVETEASAAASANDGVSPLILGDGDWVAAWSRAPRPPQPRFDGSPTSNDEWAVRVGINIVLYALTGNYKADQVHMPALLQRMGTRPGQKP